MKARDDEPSPVDLTPLKNASDAPVFDSARERALLAAFDAAWANPGSRTRSRAWRPLAAAAVVVLSAGAVWSIANRRSADVHAPAHLPPPVVRSAPPAANSAVAVNGATTVAALKAAAPRHVPTRSPHPDTRVASAFVAWPGAETLPAFESGRLMRLDLPEPVAISLGLTPRAPRSGVVRADLLIGQDGLARAVRVAP
jgi:hypothetical protein